MRNANANTHTQCDVTTTAIVCVFVQFFAVGVFEGLRVVLRGCDWFSVCAQLQQLHTLPRCQTSSTHCPKHSTAHTLTLLSLSLCVCVCVCVKLRVHNTFESDFYVRVVRTTTATPTTAATCAQEIELHVSVCVDEWSSD